MVRLEKKFYTLDEIAQVVGRERNKQFSRDCQNDLSKWQYEYQWHKRRGVIITGLPFTSEEKLTSLLRNELKLDKQVEPYEFACFITALSFSNNFVSMPWDSRTAFFNQYYGNKVTQSTLKHWMKKLVDSGNVERFKKGALWKTVKDEHGDKVQVRVDANSDEYREYCDRRSALLTDFEKADKQGRKQMWGHMVHALYLEYGVYYYSPAFVLNGLGEQAEEICRLVAQIMAEQQEQQK